MLSRLVEFLGVPLVYGGLCGKWKRRSEMVRNKEVVAFEVLIKAVENPVYYADDKVIFDEYREALKTKTGKLTVVCWAPVTESGYMLDLVNGWENTQLRTQHGLALNHSSIPKENCTYMRYYAYVVIYDQDNPFEYRVFPKGSAGDRILERMYSIYEWYRREV
jgi:hypothetical protein